jgi:hypothetical protein
MFGKVSLLNSDVLKRKRKRKRKNLNYKPWNGGNVWTGALRRPEKNFLIWRAVLMCAGNTFGRHVHGRPGSLQTKKTFLFAPSPYGSAGTGFGATNLLCVCVCVCVFIKTNFSLLRCRARYNAEQNTKNARGFGQRIRVELLFFTVVTSPVGIGILCAGLLRRLAIFPLALGYNIVALKTKDLKRRKT